MVLVTGSTRLTLAADAAAGREVSIFWQASPDPHVIGYYLYSGPASGSYSQRVDAGNFTSVKLQNLVPGVTTYFVVTAYDAQGVESLPSDEAAYLQPYTLTAILGPLPHFHLMFPVAADQTYELQYSTFLTNWTTLLTIGSKTNGIYDFADTNFNVNAQRFYRVVLR